MTTSIVGITIKKTIDIEQIYKTTGKHCKPTLLKEFTGVIIII